MRQKLKEQLDAFNSPMTSLEEAELHLNIALEEEAEEEAEEIAEAFAKIRKGLDKLALTIMLAGENDRANAIVSIHPGAGGVEAQDWAEMLLRMYLRWTENKGFKASIVDYQPGEEAGVKSVTVTVEGLYAYGLLKAEVGIHRLVRISPFDVNRRRHTSFASVFVYPEIDQKIEVDIKEDELRVDTYRSSSAGGQHVNKTDSAVRITHLPSGIVVQCQNERSQHKNKATAMKILKSRLYDLRLREEQEKMDKFHASKKEIAWGSQIRSYVNQPYRMVKDHRTKLETSNVDEVLDGDLDRFIEAYLLQNQKS